MTRTVSCLLAFALFGPASRAAAQNTGVHAWANIDVASSRASQGQQTFSLLQPKFDEIATRSVTYSQFQSARVPLVAAGVLAFHGLGAGVRFDTATRNPNVALQASVPHPFFFQRPGVGTLNPALNAKEQVVDLFALYAVPTPSRWSVRVFAGGSRVHVSDDVVADFTYSQTAGLSGSNVVKIESYRTATLTTTAWGWHAGADIAFFPLRNVGVGFGILDRRVDLPAETEPFVSKPFVLSTDRVVASVGLRLRL